MKKFFGILLFIATPFIIFFLINFDFKGNFSEKACYFCNKSLAEENGIPESWLERYSLEVKNKEDIESDLDGDDLSLLAEYQNSTNPLNPDTDGDGYNDGKEVRDGYSPIGEGKLDKDRDGLPDFWENEVGLNTSKDDSALDPDKDGLSNELEFAHATNPFNGDTDEDGFSDRAEIQNGYDPSEGGVARPQFAIKIVKIDIEAPVIWSKSDKEKDLLKDLEKGVTRLPKTGIPGQSGNTVISGHSSNYIWAKGDYNYIFQDLNNIIAGDKIILKTTQANGKTFEKAYIIKSKAVVKPDDSVIFTQSDSEVITLVTCWPLRTTWKRLIIKAEPEIL